MRLIWADQAERDIDAIADHYAELAPGLDKIMIDRVEAAPMILLQQPRLGPSVGPFGWRKWPVKRTGYVLLYRVLPEAIEITRVVHAMSDWRSPFE